MRAFILVLVLSVVVPHRGSGFQAANENDTVRVARSRIYPLPIFFYTPETGIAGGAAALYLIRDSASSRPSSITGDAIYTERKQIILELDGDLYWQNDTYRLLSSLVFQRFPNKFFGIGNFTAVSNEETYTPESFAIRAVLYRKIFSRYNIGPLVRYESVSMYEVNPSGLLAPGTIVGSKGGKASGVGLVANWDSRDNTFAAASGSFYQATALFYHHSLGSDYDYSDIQLDTRHFFEIIPAQVLAIQAAAEFQGGAVPFQSLVRFGGQNIVRGYFDGRYRDKNGVALQAEYRAPVWWRFGVVGFAGVAQVADHAARFALNRFWFAGGLGLRFFWNPEERVSLRLDYGVGNNSSGMYITVTEAF
jgi:outer membrane protein assembly factor BamA